MRKATSAGSLPVSIPPKAALVLSAFTLGALALAACEPAPATEAAPSAQAPAQAPAATQGQADHTQFDAFFADFRQAVLDNDRQRVAELTSYPFIDYRIGRYCEPGQADCVVADDSLTSADEAAFLANYDRIFTAPVIQAIRNSATEAAPAGADMDEAAGPIIPGEFILRAGGPDHERVFRREAQTGPYRLQRVPFYS